MYVKIFFLSEKQIFLPRKTLDTFKPLFFARSHMVKKRRSDVPECYQARENISLIFEHEWLYSNCLGLCVTFVPLHVPHTNCKPGG